MEITQLAVISLNEPKSELTSAVTLGREPCKADPRQQYERYQKKAVVLQKCWLSVVF